MKVLIGGSRDFNDYDYLERNIKNYNISKIITGGAKGADTLAEQYAKKHNIPIRIIKPEWNKYGKKAGMVRNIEMLKKCDFAIFFWDGKSPGTKQAIDYAKKHNIDHIVFFYNRKSPF